MPRLRNLSGESGGKPVTGVITDTSSWVNVGPEVEAVRAVVTSNWVGCFFLLNLFLPCLTSAIAAAGASFAWGEFIFLVEGGSARFL